ncbi:isoleucyl-tRNA synthetase [Coniosporium apollinis CBS 100218]|uniref:Isoleucine--tRNA ligase, mitochondrial n=1 Tax=Coniosporium apollinis (strain CBS 100218) TaxID=1168221 RepID=R7YKT7_CONA1|nr:isoleucyl-tRNA synthetase [Coniosporium apollinis CBS 100218]EON62429.1 isoleucyl-tRNA synthetase [Coniosporium apollinis CBS 100218]
MLTPTRLLRASWSTTLKLPKSAFPPRPADPKTFLPRCTDELYAWQATHRPAANVFVLHDGPPYANGDLHVGHALNKILKDIICRFQLGQGKRVQYIPGWDCHGLPIEIKALQALQLRGEGDHEKIGAVEVRKAARRLAEETIERQKKGFKEWAVMGDWDNAYRTMEKGFETSQLRVWKGMVEKGLIYRQYKPVYWSPSSGTALAEAELEYDDNHRSTAAFVRFPLITLAGPLASLPGVKPDAISAVIWTTTPWTLPANNAIAVHADLDYCVVELPSNHQLIVAQSRLNHVLTFLNLELKSVKVVAPCRGSDLLGSEYTNILQHSDSEPAQTQPILQADFVSADSGTGLVHMAAGHGMDDYNVCMKLGIPAFAPVDDQGRFTLLALPAQPGFLAGKAVQKEGTDAVLEWLDKLNSQSGDGQLPLVLATHEIRHKYPIDWRTKQPVIIRATEQWFADVDEIKAGALESLEDVTFIPETGHTRLSSFVRGRSQWCVSRQRAWGVPVPALYRKTEDGLQAVMTSGTIEYIMKVIDDRGIDAWWTDAEDDAAWVAPELEAGTYVRGKDTMDVWFDSGTTWTLLEDRAAQGLPVADVYLEGTDQHRGWFQSSLLTYIAHQSAQILDAKHPLTSALKHPMKAPYKTLITHGFALDAEGRKMSKSLGNVVSPAQIMDGSLLPPVSRKKKKQKGQEKAAASSATPSYDAMGADALRLWVASSDYTRDVVIGQPVLQSINTSLHKYRVTFKWLLGVLNDYDPSKADSKASSSTDLADRIASHQLSLTSAAVHRSYQSYDFFKGVYAVNRYITTDLSAFYFEPLKDRLYAGSASTRLAAQAALYKIFNELLHMLAPVTPLLVEEVWAHCPPNLKEGREGPGKDVWAPFAAPSMADETQRRDMETTIAFITAAFTAVKSAQEIAREEKLMGGGLECGFTLYVPPTGIPSVEQLLNNSMEEELASLFVVSDVKIVRSHEPEQEESGGAWSFRETFEVELEEGTEKTKVTGAVVVTPAEGKKCPRCWRFVAPEPETLCGRCEGVVKEQG